MDFQYKHWITSSVNKMSSPPAKSTICPRVPRTSWPRSRWKNANHWEVDPVTKRKKCKKQLGTVEDQKCILRRAGLIFKTKVGRYYDKLRMCTLKFLVLIFFSEKVSGFDFFGEKWHRVPLWTKTGINPEYPWNERLMVKSLGLQHRQRGSKSGSMRDHTVTSTDPRDGR